MPSEKTPSGEKSAAPLVQPEKIPEMLKELEGRAALFRKLAYLVLVAVGLVLIWAFVSFQNAATLVRDDQETVKGTEQQAKAVENQLRLLKAQKELQQFEKKSEDNKKQTGD